MWLVVEFTDDKELAVIPDLWLDGTSCALWPPYKTSGRIMSAVTQKEAPGDSWKSFPIKELYRSELYDKARRKTKIAENESDLQTVDSEDNEVDDGPTHRRSKRKRRARRNSSDESDENDDLDIPRPPVRKSNTALPIPPPHVHIPTASPMRELSPISANRESPLQVHRTPTATSMRELSPTPADTESPPRLQHSQTATLMRPESSTSRVTHNVQESWDRDERLQNTTPATERPSRPLQVSQARDLRLFTILERMKEEQVDQRAMLQTILQLVQAMQTTSAMTGARDLPEDVSFPLEEGENMNNIEEKLQDRTVSEGIVNYLSILRGKDTPDTVKRILRHVITNQLAAKYNWYGKKGKLRFGQLKLASIIYKAVRKTRNATQSEVEAVTREWLRTASDRDGGRKKRDKKTSTYEECMLSHN